MNQRDWRFSSCNGYLISMKLYLKKLPERLWKLQSHCFALEIGSLKLFYCYKLRKIYILNETCINTGLSLISSCQYSCLCSCLCSYLCSCLCNWLSSCLCSCICSCFCSCSSGCPYNCPCSCSCSCQSGYLCSYSYSIIHADSLVNLLWIF